MAVHLSRRSFVAGSAAIAAGLPFGARAAGITEVRVASQIGLAYLPLYVMQHDKLWEQQAEKLGQPIAVSYIPLGGGAALNDALISGSVHVVAGGVAPMLTVWDRTMKNFRIKGLSAINSAPMHLLTNNPKVQSVRDFTDTDRIAVPSIKVSLQAIALGMIAEKELGHADALDTLEVAMAHPEAYAALTSGAQITAYMANSPFQERALKQPGIRKIGSLFDVAGGPVTLSVAYAASSFVDSNPLLAKAYMSALDQAVASIEANRELAIDKYLEVTGDHTERALLIEIMNDPQTTFGSHPLRTMTIAKFMHRIGLLKTEPQKWSDYFFDTVSAGTGS
jgi:NitT/TauT family transport system substrate-binding protein